MQAQWKPTEARKHGAKKPPYAGTTQGSRHVHTQRKETNACKRDTSQGNRRMQDHASPAQGKQ